MSKAMCGCLAFVVIWTMSPDVCLAGSFPNPFKRRCRQCCPSCRKVRSQCECSPSRPVVNRNVNQHRSQQYAQQNRQQPNGAHREESEIEYRVESYVETVPVTTFHEVTVDEGGYQCVWVPKLVKKKVPRTEYQQQTNYRSVPYKVTRLTPQAPRGPVPPQAIRYVPRQTRGVWHAPTQPTQNVWRAPVRQQSQMLNAPTYPVPPALVPAAPVPGQGWPTPPIAAIPRTSQLPRSPAPAPTQQLHALPNPVPDPKFLDVPSEDKQGEWTTVKPRKKSESASLQQRLGGYVVNSRRVAPSATKSASTAKRVIPAPSAAAVWQTRHAPAN